MSVKSKIAQPLQGCEQSFRAFLKPRVSKQTLGSHWPTLSAFLDFRRTYEFATFCAKPLSDSRSGDRKSTATPFF